MKMRVSEAIRVADEVQRIVERNVPASAVVNLYLDQTAMNSVPVLRVDVTTEGNDLYTAVFDLTYLETAQPAAFRDRVLTEIRKMGRGWK